MEFFDLLLEVAVAWFAAAEFIFGPILLAVLAIVLLVGIIMVLNKM